MGRLSATLVLLLAGCGEMPQAVALSDLTPTVAADLGHVTADLAPPERVSYSVIAPYALKGASDIGPDGDVYSAVPQIGADPYTFVFSYRGLAFSFQEALSSGCCNEEVPVAYADLVMSGSQSCSNWRGTFTIAAPDPTARWHISINAQCVTNLSLYLRGDWKASH